MTTETGRVFLSAMTAGGSNPSYAPLDLENARLLVLTGAGVSAESGLATFRDSNGLWEQHRVEDVASPEGFARDPELVWKFYSLRREQAKTDPRRVRELERVRPVGGADVERVCFPVGIELGEGLFDFRSFDRTSRERAVVEHGLERQDQPRNNDHSQRKSGQQRDPTVQAQKLR